MPIRWASSLGEAIDSMTESQPSLTFLDDILKPSADAFLSISELRRAGYIGPVIVVSGAVTQMRRTRLIAGGASDVIHKDDVDSVRLAEAVDRSRTLDPPTEPNDETARRLGRQSSLTMCVIRAVTCRTHDARQHSAAAVCLIRLGHSLRGVADVRTHGLVVCATLSASSMAFAEEIKLPPEVTPALRCGLRERRSPPRLRRQHADLFRGQELRRRQVHAARPAS